MQIRAREVVGHDALFAYSESFSIPEAFGCPAVNSLLLGDRKKVAENTLKCPEAAGTEKYVLMSGCGVPPDTPMENVKVMIRTAIEYGLGTDQQ